MSGVCLFVRWCLPIRHSPSNIYRQTQKKSIARGVMKWIFCFRFFGTDEPPQVRLWRPFSMLYLLHTQDEVRHKISFCSISYIGNSLFSVCVCVLCVCVCVSFLDYRIIADYFFPGLLWHRDLQHVGVFLSMVVYRLNVLNVKPTFIHQTPYDGWKMVLENSKQIKLEYSWMW